MLLLILFLVLNHLLLLLLIASHVAIFSLAVDFDGAFQAKVWLQQVTVALLARIADVHLIYVAIDLFDDFRAENSWRQRVLMTVVLLGVVLELIRALVFLVHGSSNLTVARCQVYLKRDLLKAGCIRALHTLIHSQVGICGRQGLEAGVTVISSLGCAAI